MYVLINAKISGVVLLVIHKYRFQIFPIKKHILLWIYIVRLEKTQVHQIHFFMYFNNLKEEYMQ